MTTKAKLNGLEILSVVEGPMNLAFIAVAAHLNAAQMASGMAVAFGKCLGQLSVDMGDTSDVHDEHIAFICEGVKEAARLIWEAAQ